MTLNFQDPPAEGNRGPGSTWPETFSELREHPNKWVLLREAVSSGHVVAQNIKKGIYKGSVPGEFEATTRSKVQDGKRLYDVYVRYIGQEE